MASALATLVKNDARQQFRYGIHAAYAFVIGFYICVLVFAADFLPNWMPGLIVFTDPAVVGFFFLGALMLLEKGENVRTALAVTPISASDYFWSKTITLTGLAVLSVLVLSLFFHHGSHLPLLMSAVILTSVQFLGLGILTAYRFKTVTSYLMGAAGLLTPVVAPGFLALLDPMPLWAIIIPAASQFRLILVAIGYGSATMFETIAMFTVAILAAAICVLLGVRRLQREFGG